MSTAFEKYSQGSKLGDVELPNTQNIRIDSLVDFADFSDGEWHQVRLFPGVCAFATYWFDVLKRDGTTTQVPKPSLNFDIRKAVFDTSKGCPYGENRDRLTCRGEQGAQLQVHYYVNVLDRELQQNEPKKRKVTNEEEESGFKDKSSKSWTPIRVARFPRSLIEKLQKKQELNRVKGESYELSDPKFGRDVYILFNKGSKNPGNMWDVDLVDEPSKLSKEEKTYLMYDIEKALDTIQSQESGSDAEKWLEKHFERMGAVEVADKKGKKAKKVKKPDKEVQVAAADLLDDGDDEPPKKKGKKGKKKTVEEKPAEDPPAKKGKNKKEAASDYNDEEAPKKKKAKKDKGKPKFRF